MQCSVTSGSVPNVVAYASKGALSEDEAASAGYHAGVALVIPLSTPKTNSCDKPMSLHTAAVSLEIAENLLMNGTLSKEEYQAISNKVKAKLYKMLD